MDKTSSLVNSSSQTATTEALSGLNIDLWAVLEVLNESLSFQECGLVGLNCASHGHHFKHRRRVFINL